MDKIFEGLDFVGLVLTPAPPDINVVCKLCPGIFHIDYFVHSSSHSRQHWYEGTQGTSTMTDCIFLRLFCPSTVLHNPTCYFVNVARFWKLARLLPHICNYAISCQALAKASASKRKSTCSHCRGPVLEHMLSRAACAVKAAPDTNHTHCGMPNHKPRHKPSHKPTLSYFLMFPRSRE